MDKLLRHVWIGAGEFGYVLKLWDTGRIDSLGRSKLAYNFGPADDTAEIAESIFAGDDFTCSPLYAIDSDACLRALLGFLVLRPGDTDRDYFDSYTAQQLKFAESVDADEVSGWVEEELEFEDACLSDSSADFSDYADFEDTLAVTSDDENSDMDSDRAPTPEIEDAGEPDPDMWY